MNTFKLSAPKVQNRLFDVVVETVLSYGFMISSLSGAVVWDRELVCKDPCAISFFQDN